MTELLNLDDIQGNITRAYGRYAYPFARYFFLHIDDAGAGRQFVNRLRAKVTTAARWDPSAPPPVTLNVGFTFFGLYMLGLPTRTLQAMPESFIDGMKARAFILGDRDVTKTEVEAGTWDDHWDPIWQANREKGGAEDVHIWISMNARLAKLGNDEPVPELERQTQWLRDLCAQVGGKVRILATNGKTGDQEYQSASAVFTEVGGARFPTAKEHFGLTDGIGDPAFRGQYPPEQEKTRVIGRGKWMDRDRGWEPIATGEFLLGHPDESQELPPTAMPPNFMHNGSFMVYRKLHENVATFHEVIETEAAKFAAQQGIAQHQAVETLTAKMVGRWSDGVPLATVPTFEGWMAFREKMKFDDPDDPLAGMARHRAYLRSPEASDFRYADDMGGFKCPGGAHLRRVNTRDYLDPLNAPSGRNAKATTQLNKRRRILRRGLPYGASFGEKTDDTEQGVAMMIVGANIFRQFEFVQQQWIQYGLDFNQGNNTCPLLGRHEVHKRFTVPADPESGKPPFVVGGLKTFVETRGGDYFFLPSMTALDMIAIGSVDPT